MIRAVLDTNVILASLLSRRGASFEIMERLRRSEWQLVLSNQVMLEYEEVLKRNAPILQLSLAAVDLYLNAIAQGAEEIIMQCGGPPRLPDADDEPLLRLAEASGARLITTHNLRHFAAAAAYGVAVLPPSAFLRMLRAQP